MAICTISSTWLGTQTELLLPELRRFPLPTLTLLSASPVLSLFVWEELTIQSITQVPSGLGSICLSGTSDSELTYAWTQLTGDTIPLPDHVATSSRLALPAFTFQPGASYSFQSSTTLSLPSGDSVTGTALSTIHVATSPLVAHVVPEGTARVHPVSDLLVLNASGSYDPDLNPATWEGQEDGPDFWGLQATWACEVVGTGGACFAAEDVATSGHVLQMDPTLRLEEDVAAVYLFTVTVTPVPASL